MALNCRKLDLTTGVFQSANFREGVCMRRLTYTLTYLIFTITIFINTFIIIFLIIFFTIFIIIFIIFIIKTFIITFIISFIYNYTRGYSILIITTRGYYIKIACSFTNRLIIINYLNF